MLHGLFAWLLSPDISSWLKTLHQDLALVQDKRLHFQKWKLPVATKLAMRKSTFIFFQMALHLGAGV